MEWSQGRHSDGRAAAGVFGMHEATNGERCCQEGEKREEEEEEETCRPAAAAAPASGAESNQGSLLHRILPHFPVLAPKQEEGQ